MDNQTKTSGGISGSGKKKNKKKLLTFVEGSKADPLLVLTKDDNEQFIRRFNDAISKNPDLQLPQADLDRSNFKRKSVSKVASTASPAKISLKEEEKQEKPRRETPAIKKEIVFGINEILRSIESGLCVGVVLTNPLSTHLQLGVNELCREKNIKCLNVTSFHELDNVFNISSLTGIGFKNSAHEQHALAKPIFSIFREFVARADHSHPSNSAAAQDEVKVKQVPHHESKSSSTTTSSSSVVDEKKSTRNKLNFITPTFEQLYVLREERTHVEPSGANSPDDTGGLCLSMSKLEDDYFPELTPSPSLDEKDILITTNYAANDQEQFTEDLMEEEEETVAIRRKTSQKQQHKKQQQQQSLKRKNSDGGSNTSVPQSKQNAVKRSKFNPPQVKHVEPSGKGRSKQNVKKQPKNKKAKK